MKTEPQPYLQGPHGQAWKVDLAAIAAKRDNKPHASLVTWVVKAPWAHPVWHSYSINLIHLRPLLDFPPPTIHLSGATHEVIVFALDPAWKLNLQECAPYLLPANFVGQFVEPDDAFAARRVEQCVIDIVNGKLSPDTDFMQHWIARFSASNIKGDPARAGETVVVAEYSDGRTERIVYDPAPLDKKPKL